MCKEEKFVTWANNWLNGTDRSPNAANAAAYAADAVNAAYAAANAAAYAAANADDEFDLQSIAYSLGK